MNDVDEAIKWIDALDLDAWRPDNSIWTKDLLAKETVKKGLKDVGMLSGDAALTTLCGRKWLECDCIDRTIRTISARNEATAQVFALPASVAKFPVYDVKSIKNDDVWGKVEAALRETATPTKS
ncbi:hypothetical protein L915_13870, partial [Phytophthora nicotianae]